MPRSAVPGRAVPVRARASAVPGGPFGHIYFEVTVMKGAALLLDPKENDQKSTFGYARFVFPVWLHRASSPADAKDFQP